MAELDLQIKSFEFYYLHMSVPYYFIPNNHHCDL